VKKLYHQPSLHCNCSCHCPKTVRKLGTKPANSEHKAAAIFRCFLMLNCMSLYGLGGEFRLIIPWSGVRIPPGPPIAVEPKVLEGGSPPTEANRQPSVCLVYETGSSV